MRLTGSTAQLMSGPVNNIDLTDSNLHALTWEPTTESVLWRKLAVPPVAPHLAFNEREGTWTWLDLEPASGNAVGHTGQVGAVGKYRQPELAYYNPTAGSPIVVSVSRRFDVPVGFADSPGSGSAGITATVGWIWATPIVNLSDIYQFFSFGGFRIDARGDLATNPALNWTVYGGSTPQSMNVRDTGTFSYALGTQNARNLLGGKLDDAFVAIVLSASRWIELTGVVIYDSSNTARR